jgi:hypothetical protein
VNDAQKEGRGLISVTMAGADGAAVAPGIGWRIQGGLGGEDLADPARGPLNTGGLYGERHGWYLPGYPDARWATTTLPEASAAPGTTWYRTNVHLDVPQQDDASIGLTIGDPRTPQADGDYRALIYVNGWNLGQYIANVGPQHTFVLPNGVLNPHGTNTIALAVTSNGGAGNGLEKIALTDLGTVRGGVRVHIDKAPGWNAHTYGTPTVPNRVSMSPLTSTDAPQRVEPGDTFTVTGTLSDDTGPDLHDVTASLDAPAGWTAQPTRTVPGTIAAGGSAPVGWTVTVGDDAAPGKYAVAAVATYTQGGRAGRTGSTYQVSIAQKGLLYVSDLDWASSTNGYGPVERDQNVGGTGQGDGAPLTMRGVVYAKGLGTNAVSSVVLDLGGRCSSFSTDVGLDDSAGGKGSVVFSVLADGTKVAGTGVMHGNDPVQHLSADLTGVRTLELQVGDAGDGVGHDNGDWGGAQILCS